MEKKKKYYLNALAVGIFSLFILGWFVVVFYQFRANIIYRECDRLFNVNSARNNLGYYISRATLKPVIYEIEMSKCQDASKVFYLF